MAPSVISCEGEPPREREPPGEERTSMHPWCSDASREVCENSPPRTYIYKIAEEKMRNHARQGLEARQEVMGLMVGGVFTWQGREYTLIRDVVTTDLESDMVSVRFHADGHSGLIDALDDLDFNYRIVGWYHSHPGIGCFLSHVDHGTQRGIFNQSYHSALVLDPERRELEVYSGMDLISFRLYWDNFQNPC